MRFTVPIIYTTTGYITVEGEGLDDVKNKIDKMTEEELDFYMVEGETLSREVCADEIEVENV